MTCLAGVAAAGDASKTADIAAGLGLAKQKACMACHQVETRRVGPPLRAIGERFAGAADEAATIEYLAKAIREGGRGRWGAITMPAQPQVSAAEAQRLAEWILVLGQEGAAR